MPPTTTQPASSPVVRILATTAKTLKLAHPWPFPVHVHESRAYKVQQPKPQRKPAPQFEDALF